MWHLENWGQGLCNGTAFWGVGHGLFGGILPLLFWGFIIFFIISMIRKLIPEKHSIERESPLDVLKKRYASGEIDQEEFLEMRSTLTSR